VTGVASLFAHGTAASGREQDDELAAVQLIELHRSRKSLELSWRSAFRG